jgi:hypothetical protein
VAKVAVMNGENAEEIRRETDALMVVQQPAAAYQQQPGAAAPEGEPGTPSAAPASGDQGPESGEDVVDGEFRNV